MAWINTSRRSFPQTLENKRETESTIIALRRPGQRHRMENFSPVVSPYIVAPLFELGAQLNEKYAGVSAWEHVLASLWQLLSGPKPQSPG